MKLTKVKLLDLIKKGETTFSGADFSGENLDGLEIDGSSLLFSYANFKGASLRGAKIRQLNLLGSNFQEADLSGSTFELCMMIAVDFYQATCKGTNFFGGTFEDSCLVSTDFSYSNLLNVDFQNSLVGYTDFRGTSIGFLRNFDKVKMAEVPQEMKSQISSKYVPVHIDMQTIKLTAEMQRKIHESEGLEGVAATPNQHITSFFEKNGVDSAFINAYRSLYSRREEKTQSVFISYSTSDQSFADWLYKELRNKEVKVWYAPKDMVGGKTIHDQVRAAIQSYDRVLLVLSDNSIKSKWVMTEISHAYSREKNRNEKVLFPISIVNYDTLQKWELFDSDEGHDLAKYIRSYFVPDFTLWQRGENISQEVTKLIQALTLDKE